MTADRTDKNPGFSLVSEQWIPVIFTDGSPGFVSLFEAFRDARTIREVACELATQTFAVLRLQIAILYRVLFPIEITPELYEKYARDGLPMGDIADYLDEFGSRFDLFDGRRPFFQVPDLEAVNGTVKEAGILVADLSPRPLFGTRAGIGAKTLSLREAALWLVHTQAYCPSGILTGAVGDPRVKGGKGYPQGTGWAGQIGGVYANGETLEQTLLLNLVGTMETSENDIPPWEDAEADTAAVRAGLTHYGPVRVLVAQSRRIRLFRENGRVAWCVLSYGDPVAPQNMFHYEAMTSWRFSEPQTKKVGRPTYMPRIHQKERAMWRGLAAMLPQERGIDPKSGHESIKAPELMNWISVLAMAQVLPPAMTIRLRGVGMAYGTQNAVVDDVIADEVALPVAIIARDAQPLATEVDLAVQRAENGVRALSALARSIDQARGGSGGARVDDASRQAYLLLGKEFSRWLMSFSDEAVDLLSARAKWDGAARQILLGLGERLVGSSGVSAWRGRWVGEGNTRELITSYRAEAIFRSKMWSIFPAEKGIGEGVDDE